jgi:hypothetical protein
MKKTSKNSSFLSGVFRIFKSSPTPKAMKTAQRARIQEKHNKQSPGGTDFPYRAAEIVVEDCACDAVRVLTGNRFLLDEVPHIPVANCTSRKCTCTYVRHKDRRNKYEERRAEFSALTNAYTTIGNSERRGSAGRRADDAPLSQLL